jgi:hypothetical protein
MKPHTKCYIDFFQKSGLEPHELMCEICGKGGGSSMNLDINHIENRGMGGSKREEHIDNLMALCRSCHSEFGDITDLIPILKEIHGLYMGSHIPFKRGNVKREDLWK